MLTGQHSSGAPGPPLLLRTRPLRRPNSKRLQRTALALCSAASLARLCRPGGPCRGALWLTAGPASNQRSPAAPRRPAD